MRAFVAFVAGFLTLFNFVLITMILLFMWPRMLPTLADGTYVYMDTAKFILAGALFCGLLGGCFSGMLEEFDGTL